MPTITSDAPTVVGYALYRGVPMPIYANRRDSLRRVARLTRDTYRTHVRQK